MRRAFLRATRYVKIAPFHVADSSKLTPWHVEASCVKDFGSQVLIRTHFVVHTSRARMLSFLKEKIGFFNLKL